MAITYVNFNDSLRVGAMVRSAVNQLRGARETLKKLVDILGTAVDDPTTPTDFTTLAALLGSSGTAAGTDSAALYALIIAANTAVTVSGVSNLCNRAG